MFIAIYATMTVVLVSVIAAFYLIAGRPDWHLMVIAAVPVPLFLGTTLILALLDPNLWRSQRRMAKAPFKDVTGPVEKALVDGGLGPVIRKGRRSAILTEAKVFDLRGGLDLTILNGYDRTALYLGPDRDEKRRELEQAKQVIDRALEGMEARPPPQP